MPTGYTADLKMDTPLSAFILKCARAMGALIMMRDDQLDAPIPDEFEPSDYYRKSLEDAKSRVAALAEMTLEQAAADLEKHNASMRKSAEESNAKDRAQRKIYERMIALVEAWKPPTPDHVHFKKFMLDDQLRGSLKFDCHDDRESYYKPFAGTAADWLAEIRAKATKDVAYYEKQWNEEVQRQRERSNWVKALRKSLQAVSANEATDLELHQLRTKVTALERRLKTIAESKSSTNQEVSHMVRLTGRIIPGDEKRGEPRRLIIYGGYFAGYLEVRGGPLADVTPGQFYTVTLQPVDEPQLTETGYLECEPATNNNSEGGK